ncbi:MAG TPA: prolyl oligopeptidase, partial [Pirellulaceae bacterium]|nr:prolyl oligopeptidase [Pirellulaceae bacterium]
LFHADDDSNVPSSESRNFAARLTALGKDVTHKTVPSGDHYDSMIEEGIPAGIEWIKSRTAPK